MVRSGLGGAAAPMDCETSHDRSARTPRPHLRPQPAAGRAHAAGRPGAHSLDRPPTRAGPGGGRRGQHGAAGRRRPHHLREPRSRRVRARAGRGRAHRGRGARQLRERAPRRRLALPGVHGAVRGLPRPRARLRRRPRGRRGDLHPEHHRLPEPVGALPAGPRDGGGVRDRAPRRAAAVAGRPDDPARRPELPSGCHRRRRRRAPPPAAGSRAAGDHRRIQRDRRAVAGRRAGQGRPPPRRADRPGRRATGAAPGVLDRRAGRGLRGAVRPQAVRALRRRRAGRPRGLAGGGAAVPGRRRGDGVRDRRRDDVQAGARPARGRVTQRRRARSRSPPRAT